MKRSKQSPKSRTGQPNIGDEIIRGLTGFRDALARGERLSDRFTVRTVEVDWKPRRWTPSEVRALRERFNASQLVFARLIGASVKTVQSWEQGKAPPPMASRLLDCIQNDPGPWERMLHNAAIAKRAG